MRIQVKDFMSSPVIHCVGEQSVREIRALLKGKDIHAVPVVKYDKQLPDFKVTIRGIVTSSDLSQKLDEDLAVENIMSPFVHVVHQESSAQAAARMMLKHAAHHLVVMDDGKIIGMVSSLDFVSLVASHDLD